MSNVSSVNLGFEVVSRKFNTCFTTLKQVLKGLVLRFFTGERALKELSQERVQKFSTIEIRLLTVKQLNAIGIARFSVGQIKSLPSDFFLKFKKLDETVVSCLTPAQLDAYFGKREGDVKTFSSQVTSLQLKNMPAATTLKIVAFLSQDQRDKLWESNENLRPILFDPSKDEEKALKLPTKELACFLAELESEAVLSLLRKMDSDKVSELLLHVYEKDASPEFEKKIGQPFFGDEECVNRHLSKLSPQCLVTLVDKLKKVSLEKTVSFPDSLRLHLLDHLLGSEDTDLDECLNVYSDELFKQYLEKTADKEKQAKQIKCLTALINAGRNECLRGRWSQLDELNDPFQELVKLPSLTPDQVRLYWDGYNGERALVYNVELAQYNKNALRSYFFIEKGEVKRRSYVSSLAADKFYKILPMLSKDVLGNKTLQKTMLLEKDLEKYVEALCRENNSQRLEQLAIIGEVYPSLIRIAMSESLTKEEQDKLLPILFKSKKEIAECLLAVRHAAFMTNASFEERVHALVLSESNRLVELLRPLIKEGFTGFANMSTSISSLGYSDKETFAHGVGNTLKEDLDALSTSYKHLESNQDEADKLLSAYQATLKIKSFKALLEVLNKKTLEGIDFSIIEKMDTLLKDKIDNAKLIVEKQTTESDVFAYFGGAKVEILKELHLTEVKDLALLKLKNGVAVYCNGSQKDATLFRFNRYLVENEIQ